MEISAALWARGCGLWKDSIFRRRAILINVTVQWSAYLFFCLSRSCIVCKWRKILTQFLLHTTATCLSHSPRSSLPLSQIALKFGLRRSHRSPQILPQNDPLLVDLSVGDIQWQLVAEWLEVAHWSQWKACRKPISLFQMVPLLTPYDLPFPQTGIPWCCHLPNYFGTRYYYCCCCFCCCSCY